MTAVTSCEKIFFPFKLLESIKDKNFVKSRRYQVNEDTYTEQNYDVTSERLKVQSNRSKEH